MSLFKCTDTDHQKELAELRLIHEKEVQALRDEVARLNHLLQQSNAPRVAFDSERGTEYERSMLPEWV
jgi:hypothetical protein